MAQELIRLGTVTTRLHRSLEGKESQIPYPQNQQVSYKTQYTDKSHTNTDATKLKKRRIAQADEADAFAEAVTGLRKSFKSRAGGGLLATDNEALAIADRTLKSRRNRTQQS